MKKHRPRPRKPKIRHKNCDQDRAFDPTPGGMFHGGRAGLAPGSFLLPPRERGEHRTAGQIEELGLDCFSHHADYVFFYEDPLLALAFANRQTGAEMIAL